MQITHEQARKLIQLKMDLALNLQESAILSAHLRDCGECQAYANEIKEVENILSPIMKRQWNAQPAPLSIAALTGKNSSIRTNIILTMRRAAVGLVFMTLFFSAWQFWGSNTSVSSQMPQTIPPVPTPSILTAQSTSTGLRIEDCLMMSYTVQENDTLASIAGQFAISEEILMEINRLDDEAVSPGLELMIPICNFTPTGTFHAATFTTTLTPILGSMSSTPDG